MEKLYLIALLWLVVTPKNLNAQDLKDLKSPTFPAAIVINSQENEISRPKSFKQFEVAYLNNFNESGGTTLFPHNLALEVSPFLLLDKLENFDYLGYGEHLSPLKTFSLSLAFSNQFSINDSTNLKSVGIGARIQLFDGKPESNLKKKYIEKNNAIKIDIENQLLLLSNAVEYVNNEIPDSVAVITKAEYKLYLESVNPELYNKLDDKYFDNLPDQIAKTEFRPTLDKYYKELYSKKILDDFEELLTEIRNNRKGFTWDVNLALGLAKETSLISPQQGIWSNIGYAPGNSGWEFQSFLRYTNVNNDFKSIVDPENNSINLDDNFDLGAQLVYQLDKPNLEFELEYIYRLNQGNNKNANTDKLLFSVNFNLTEDIKLSYNFGKSFDSDYDLSSKNLISGISINFGFGGINSETIKNLLEKKKKENLANLGVL